jgi:hypothetical protein
MFFLNFFDLALIARRFLIRILMFGWMELDLPTPVCHCPFWGMHPNSHVAYPPQEYI